MGTITYIQDCQRYNYSIKRLVGIMLLIGTVQHGKTIDHIN